MKYDVIRKYTEEFSVTDIDYHCTHRSSIYRVKITGSEFCHVVNFNLLGRCKCNLHYNMTLVMFCFYTHSKINFFTTYNNSF